MISQKGMIMTLISSSLSFLLLVLLLLPASAGAQASVTLSVTPSLFQISAEPGQAWQSSVKVINTNSFPITVYAEPVNFAPRNESGHGKFIPVFDEFTEGATLAEWIELDGDVAITIDPEESYTLPFAVAVPEDATPGGHFAAILIGTRPPTEEGQLAVQTSQIVSSLFFVRIEGDVVEDGNIRTFSVEDRLVATPQATFEVRFENRGNVHLQPQGQIVINNMWGKERGFIPINHSTHFGNVLPDSIRTFEFSWEGEPSVTDIGRYKAEVSLAYGANTKQFETMEVVFWVLPLKPLFFTVVSIIAFIWFISWMVRAYIRRVLSMAGVESVNGNTKQRSKVIYEGDLNISNYRTISAPVRSGVEDLRERLDGIRALADVVSVTFGFIAAYKKFFLACATLVVFFLVIMTYLGDVTTNERSYEVSIENPDQAVDLNSEEIKLSELLGAETDASAVEDQEYDIEVVNVSGVPGTAAETAAKLITAGYQVTGLNMDAERNQARSTVVFDLSVQDEALLISKELNGALLSASAATSDTAFVRIFAGQDQIAE